MQAKIPFSSVALSFVFVAVALAAPAIAQDRAHGGVKLSATLNGASEVNTAGAPNQGDPDGSGAFSGRVNPGQRQVCYTLTWAGIVAPFAAHIHTGPAGVNGSVVVPLDIAPGEHCATVTRDLALDLITNPQDYYVNIHNSIYPAGAVRGQLVKH